MEEFWWRLPLLKRLPPLWRGVVVVGLLQLLLALSFSFYLRHHVANPQSGFLDDLGSVGATLFVAFVVETAATALWLTKYTPEAEAISGEAVGFGFCAFLGIALSLALRNHGANHNLTWLEALALGWAIVSLFMLGLIVAAFPLIHYERRRRPSR